MPRHSLLSALLLTLAFTTGNAHADLFGKLDQALPAKVSITTNHPVFDFDSDGCLPSAGISREGKQNGGLNPSGSLGGGCRATTFLDSSNTLHRYACIASGSDSYCGHFYALYFLKDQISTLGGGHRHDWEHAAVWTKNGVVTHAGYSAHGKLYNAEIGTLAQQSGHVKIVYHKDGVSTHALRFASSGEAAENSYGSFVAPQIISWYALKGDGVSNATLRANLNSFDYGSASIPLKDSNFLSNLNTYKPASYPSFTQASIDASQ